jgi:DNA-binding transcriptional MerR regulator
MPHQIPKLILDNARTPRERAEAIQKALALGMPLHEIEEYLDWLDSVQDSRSTRGNDSEPDVDASP